MATQEDAELTIYTYSYGLSACSAFVAGNAGQVRRASDVEPKRPLEPSVPEAIGESVAAAP
jgi:hypothetical protein